MKNMVQKKIPKDFVFLGSPPRDYQVKSFLFGIQSDVCGLLLDLGLGKTKVSIDMARYRIQYDKVEKVLVVAPTQMLYRWKEEITRFSEYTSIVVYGTRKARLEKLKQYKKYKFFIINYEALHLFQEDLMKINFGMAIFDESSRYFKTPNSRRAKAAIEIADRIKYKTLLTATLVPNDPINVWPQFRVLDKGKLFFDNFYRFRGHFFRRIVIRDWDKWKLRKDRVADFSSRIYSKCIKISKKEALSLPREVYQTLTVELSASEMTTYQEIKKKILAEVITKDGTSTVNVKHQLTKLLRLQQYTAGFVKSISGKEKALKSPPKLKATIDEIGIILEAQESVCVWCRFRKSIKLIQEELDKLEIPYITMSGEDTNAEKKYKKWKKFQSSKKIQVFIGQIESGGIGIELFKLDGSPDKYQHNITYEGVWSPDVHVQITGRTHRQGQKSMVRHVTIVVKDTIDEKMYDVRQGKQDIADLIMRQGITKVLE